jgi:hypothetical protein
MDGGEEVGPGLIVTGGDGSELLEPGEEVLDQMAKLEEVSIVIAAGVPIGPGRNDGDLASRSERFDHPLVGVECLVADQDVGLHGGQQMIGTGQIMLLAPLRKKLTGLPSASTKVWILVLSPPRDRPIASSSPVFLCAGAMLMGSYDGAVYHGVSVVGIRRQMLQDPFPDAGLGPTGKAGVNLDRYRCTVRLPRKATVRTQELGRSEQAGCPGWRWPRLPA